MKCKVCGAESGRYPLCRECNLKKKVGSVIKCEKCGKWHYTNADCPTAEATGTEYLYDKKTLLSRNEQNYFNAIKSVLPDGCYVFPQVALASIVEKQDNSRYHNELFRVMDFVITDDKYMPKVVIEVNDQTHLNADRRERDQKVRNILGEAGIPVIPLWTSYGINRDYIGKKLKEGLENPIERKVAPQLRKESEEYAKRRDNNVKYVYLPAQRKAKKSGCYIATAVYGSYDCPEVWTLRRYRDRHLQRSAFGRAFIKVYYALSPTLVKLFGNTAAFNKFWRNRLDRMVASLQENGYEDTPYKD